MVLDGRDICTTVLPDAPVKIYLTASTRTRAERRYRELMEKNGSAPALSVIEKDIAERDDRDMHREAAPLTQAPDAVYLRVIDYKSSQLSLDAARSWWGLQLQLLLYLDVCTSAIPGAKPAGAFYFYVADPLVESETDAQSIVEGKLRDLLHLRGITLSDVEIVSAMDSGDVPCVLPPLYLKSGELKKTAKALSLNELTALLRHARDVASEMAERLLDGETAISPTRDEGRVSCEHCNYQSVCRFDCQSPDAPFRELPPLSMEELRSLLGAQNTKEDQE